MPANGRSLIVAITSLLIACVVLLLSFVWHQGAVPQRFEHTSKTHPTHVFTQPYDSPHGPDTIIPGDHAEHPEMEDRFAELFTPEQKQASDEKNQIEHNVLYSRNISSDGKMWMIDFIDQIAYNPSLLPHPYKEDTFIAVANRDNAKDRGHLWNVQLVCEVTVQDQHFKCTKSPMNLPIASTDTNQCKGDMAANNDFIGPHDARIFHGPNHPFAMYVSQHPYVCLGEHLHDFRRLLYWDVDGVENKQPFFFPTPLQRPGEYGKQQKNWFLFWDSTNENMYMHATLTPKRVFAKIHADGSAGKNLAPMAEAHDSKCMAKHMPQISSNGLEFIHQATNSLAITLCNRGTCTPSSENTFNMIIFQIKTFYGRGNYFPYVMLFRRTPPFKIYGISRKPLWYHGRGYPMANWTMRPGFDDGVFHPVNQTELAFTTAMSFKSRELTMHGYLDDEVFVTFGLEDRKTGGIDVLVGDLLRDVAVCEED